MEEEIDRIKRYWDEVARNSANLPLSSGFGGASEYWDYEDKLQKKTLSQALSSLNIDIKKSTICDVGCGIGRLTLWFAKLGAQVIGIDISFQALKNASATSYKEDVYDVDFILYDGLRFPFRDSSFDIAIIVAVIPTIEKMGLTEGVISETIRVCKTGGFIFVLERVSGKPKETEYIKIVPQDRLIRLFKANGAHLVLVRGVYLDKIRFYFQYLKRYKMLWKILRGLVPVILLWSAFIDNYLTPLFPNYAEKKLFVFKKGKK